MTQETAQIAAPIIGNGLYQRRARLAFPLLVRQARSRTAVTYTDLADELGMPNPRNLNYPLGSIGRTIENLSKKWKEKIPPIQALVVSRNTGLPGEGIGFFLRDWGDFGELTRRQQREIVAGAHSMIFAYPRWDEVLEAVSLKPIHSDYSGIVSDASKLRSGSGRGGGEGERHDMLKRYVAQNPTCIGLPLGTPTGALEVALASGDCLDVSFQLASKWVAVEVKSSISGPADIVRGLFQCVKYRAVMAATQAASGVLQDARAVLVLEGKLDQEHVPLRNILGVEIFDGISGISSG